LNHGLTRFGTAAGISAEQLKQLLDQPGTTTGVSSPVRLVLHQSLHVTFWAIFALSVAIVLFAWLVPHIGLGRNREEVAR
jgi:hypothetical protein